MRPWNFPRQSISCGQTNNKSVEVMGSPQLKSQTDLQVTVCQMGSNVRALSNKEGDSFIHASCGPQY